MTGKVRRIISAFATVASIIGLITLPGIPFWAHLPLGLIGVFSFGYLVLDDIRKNRKNEKVYHSEAEVREAMKEIIRFQGKICVMSRDLSWVDDETIRIMKNKKDSMLVFAQNPNETTLKLEECGIQVRYYGKYEYEPKTRFTVIRYNRDNPQVAIANTEHTIRKLNGYRHSIYETQSGKDKGYDAWINSLALDLINLCELTTKGSNNGNLKS